MEFRILGPLEVVDGFDPVALDAAKQRTLLALLLLHPNEVVSSERVIDELWGDRPPATAGKVVQTYVSQLRRALGAAAITTRAPGYVLEVDTESVDAERFRKLVAVARALGVKGDREHAVARYREGLALWRGPPLSDVAFESFARNEVERLAEERLDAVSALIDCELALGQHLDLVTELETLVGQYPLRERFRSQLMLALYRSGRQADALDVYQNGRRLLLDELGLEPGRELQDLEKAILMHDPALDLAPPTLAAAPRVGPRDAPRTSVLPRRRALAIAAAAVAVAAAAIVVAVVATHGHSSAIKPVPVEPDSVAVIDPTRNIVVADIPTGGYPGPLAADNGYVYVGNIGSETVTMIIAKQRKLYDTFGLSRAIDMVAGDRQLWVANGGAPGHDPPGLGNGTVSVQNQGPTIKTFRVGPDMNGGAEQTTIAADDSGYSIWVGNQDSRTVRQFDRTADKTLLKIHGIEPGGLAVVGNSSAGDTVWVSDPAREVVIRIDEHKRRVVARIRVPRTPTRITADARAVWVVARDRNGPGEWRATRQTHPALWRIDPTTNKPVDRIDLPLTPLRVALGASSVWVTAERVLSEQGNSVDATLFRIDPTSNRIVARIRLRTRAVDGIVVSHGLVWAAIPPSQ